MKNKTNKGMIHKVPLPKSQLKVRELAPKLNVSKEGAQVLCPFCTIPHPIFPGKDAACGTTLKVTAVQVVIPARVARLEKLKCLKCRKSDGSGDMVRYQGGFVHLADCAPGTRLLAQPPAFSKAAKVVFRMPKKLRALVEKQTGHAQQVQEIDSDGKETGKVLGYFFLKKTVKAD